MSDSIDCSMNGAWSKTTVNVAPGLSSRARPARSGMRALTPFDTSTVLADGSLVTAMVSAGSPSTREMQVIGLSV